MGRLRVSVTLNGVPVEDRVLPVRQIVRIGESRGARVAFPGADIAVVRVGRDLAIRGRRLVEGQGIGVSLGPVRVWLEHTERSRVPPSWRGHLDPQFLAIAVLVTVSGLWLETMDAVLSSSGERGFLAREVAQMRDDGWLPSNQIPSRITGAGNRTAAVTPGGEEALPVIRPGDLRDGPEAAADDERSGMAYYEWYQLAVPAPSPTAQAAVDRLRRNPADAGAREIVARAAYETERYDEAAKHFHWLADQRELLNEPDDCDLLARLARAERRRGRHSVEAGLYRLILEQNPDDARAIGALATVMARFGRYDEAQHAIGQAALLAPEDGYLKVHAALIAAEEGRELEAIDLLEQVLLQREQLSEEFRVELRRDIALDPAFASLRADDRFRGMLARHLGAAGPRPFRN